MLFDNGVMEGQIHVQVPDGMGCTFWETFYQHVLLFNPGLPFPSISMPSKFGLALPHLNLPFPSK